MVDGFAKTPRYVFKDDSYPKCSSVLQASKVDAFIDRLPSISRSQAWFAWFARQLQRG